mmetsp:Transcript_118423/g.209309  ORF Transcript_118423/g.209309 Transcript_118423/m.209309 type:complete len:355 (-) Transcript_118423:31-1095(-)
MSTRQEPHRPAWLLRHLHTQEMQQLEELRKRRLCASALQLQEDPEFTVPDIANAPRRSAPESDRLFRRCAEATQVEGVPAGTLFEHKNWSGSVVYPGTLRDFDVYLPAGTSSGEELGLIFIADGKAAWQFATNLSIVLDNLIHQQRMPRAAAVLAGVGWEPGTGAEGMKAKETFPTSPMAMLQRIHELDTISEDYGHHILHEVLPWIEERHNIVFSSDPSLRCIAGQSSGAICAFNVAWTRPESFSLVLAVSTSFCNSIPGYLFPREVRWRKKKPLRFYLTAGEYDLSDERGDWAEHTRLMGSALAGKGYDHVVEIAKGGGHTLRYTGSRLAFILEWLFRVGWDGRSGSPSARL